jgi:hypothetical protein
MKKSTINLGAVGLVLACLVSVLGCKTSVDDEPEDPVFVGKITISTKMPVALQNNVPREIITGTGFTAKTTTWKDNFGKPPTDEGFGPDKIYKSTYVLTPAPGYTFGAAGSYTAAVTGPYISAGTSTTKGKVTSKPVGSAGKLTIVVTWPLPVPGP